MRIQSEMAQKVAVAPFRTIELGFGSRNRQGPWLGRGCAITADSNTLWDRPHLRWGSARVNPKQNAQLAIHNCGCCACYTGLETHS
jgi:hypothetical protein